MRLPNLDDCDESKLVELGKSDKGVFLGSGLESNK